ncbi:hypothetical protein OH77DRAFT_676922 [Trametes cingulata]|nr:hypothetical protein OH77DRAFT_676922 [Trametes cingulata]
MATGRKAPSGGRPSSARTTVPTSTASDIIKLGRRTGSPCQHNNSASIAACGMRGFARNGDELPVSRVSASYALPVTPDLSCRRSVMPVGRGMVAFPDAAYIGTCVRCPARFRDVVQSAMWSLGRLQLANITLGNKCDRIVARATTSVSDIISIFCVCSSPLRRCTSTSTCRVPTV